MGVQPILGVLASIQDHKTMQATVLYGDQVFVSANHCVVPAIYFLP